MSEPAAENDEKDLDAIEKERQERLEPDNRPDNA